MSEGEPDDFLPKLERKAWKGEMPLPQVASGFHHRRLMLGIPPDYQGETEEMWRVHEGKVNIPGVGPAKLRVEYFKEFEDVLHKDLTRELVKFDFFTEEPGEGGQPEPIAEMWWSRTGPEHPDIFPNDLRQQHRYVYPKFRNRMGVGKFTYGISETWAKELAELNGGKLDLALSTDQPGVMDMAEGYGYKAHPDFTDVRTEIIEHPEHFALVEEEMYGQTRGPALKRNGKSVRLWFEKPLRA